VLNNNFIITGKMIQAEPTAVNSDLKKELSLSRDSGVL